MDLRCDSKILHGIVDGDFIEVTCRSRRCGKEPGVVVLHTFNVHTGKCVKTQKFKEVSNGSCFEGFALRDEANQSNPARR